MSCRSLNDSLGLPKNEIHATDIAETPKGVIVQYHKPVIMKLSPELKDTITNSLNALPALDNSVIRHGGKYT